MSVPTAIETTAGESLVELKKNKHIGTTTLKPDDPVHPVWKAGQLTDPDDPKPLYDDFWIREIFNGKSKTIFEERPDFEAANDDPKVWETEFGRIEQYYESVGGKVFSYNRRFVLDPETIEQTVEDGWASDTLYGVMKELNENIAKALVVDDLKHHLDEIDTLDVLKEPRNVEALHTHERYRSLVTQMWKSQHGSDPEKTHLWGSLVKEKPTTFQIEQFPQGFFVIPRLYNGHICRVIDEELKERDLGKFSLAWRGFIVEPENFSEVTELIGPLYVDTPGVELW
ncbi:hypothetical protein HRTV-10_gp104 [Halorubrum tailed virus 10]|uniref:Uncharacterized protein n=1 Tax=Halorubrum tailed virus 10 TaxID=2877991 RepID=A0AAE9BVB8_9CAUD|nr:hypothetical protein M1M36_gp028 [Halorubrum tailed virus 10]UBF19688.1 hypothetical protein HRTV-10_gp104 [Halorubrum tailed virus 10]